jgi:hypothetical protein
MAAIYESEWQLLMEVFKNDPAPRAKRRWADEVEEEEDPLVYDEGDFDHLYVWNKDATALILTVHPEMGLAHKHVEVEPCVKGTKGDSRDIYTGYFMCLAPVDDAEEEVEDENAHAIEAISVTWEQGEETLVKAVVRNPHKRPPKCSSVRGESRGARLFNRDVAESKPSPEEHRFNRPHEPRPSNPCRTIRKVRHKDVNRLVVRVVVNVGPKFTRALVRMLNLQRPTRDLEMPQHPSRFGGRDLAEEYLQPCISENSDQGDWLTRDHEARQLAHRESSHSTQTPRFEAPGTTTPRGCTTSAPRTKAPSSPRKKART